MALLRSAPEQDDEDRAVAPEVNPITRPKIEPMLEHAAADALHAREVALFNFPKGDRDPCGRHGVEAVKPCSERTFAVGIDVFQELEHPNGNVNDTIETR